MKRFSPNRTGAWLALCLLAAPAGLRADEPGDALVAAITNAQETLQAHGVRCSPELARQAAIEAVVRAADPGGRVYTPAEAEACQAVLRGQVYDVGLCVTRTNGACHIIQVEAGSPAAKAGIQTNELVEVANGAGVASQRWYGVCHPFRAAQPGSVTLRIRRPDADTAREVRLTRVPVTPPAVDLAEELPRGLCYLRINDLNAGAGEEIVACLRQWRKMKCDGVVLDLRGAAGTDVAAAAQVAGLFGDPGALVLKVRDAAGTERPWTAPEDTLKNVPVMALVDERTRGAAEVLAAALAGSARGAMLVGQPTAGDPCVREMIAVAPGRLAYVATRRLVMRDGATYDGRAGVRPDVTISPESAAAPAYEPEGFNGRNVLPEEKEDRFLRERVRGDPVLQRAVDILKALKALGIRAYGDTQNAAAR